MIYCSTCCTWRVQGKNNFTLGFWPYSNLLRKTSFKLVKFKIIYARSITVSEDNKRETGFLHQFRRWLPRRPECGQNSPEVVLPLDSSYVFRVCPSWSILILNFLLSFLSTAHFSYSSYRFDHGLHHRVQLEERREGQGGNTR